MKSKDAANNNDHDLPDQPANTPQITNIGGNRASIKRYKCQGCLRVEPEASSRHIVSSYRQEIPIVARWFSVIEKYDMTRVNLKYDQLDR